MYRYTECRFAFSYCMRITAGLLTINMDDNLKNNFKNYIYTTKY